jgi:purine-nucleoside phosphorylase
MPYLDASTASLQRMFGIAEGDLPDAAIVVGQWGQAGYFEHLSSIWADAREIEERSMLVEIGGRHVWVSVVFGAPMAATIAHFAVKLGARAVIQIGSIGGLAPGWSIGDVLVPSLVVGRDGVSRQLSRNKPIEPSADLSDHLASELAISLTDSAVRVGRLVSTTTISLERQGDIARWRRAGFVGVEMECAATVSMARHFGAAATGAFVLVDNVVDGHTFYDLTDTQEAQTRAAKDVTLRASVASALWYLENHGSDRPAG